MVGIHFSKSGDGMEGNFQVALRTTRKKRYEMVSKVEEPVENVQGEPEPT